MPTSVKNVLVFSLERLDFWFSNETLSIESFNSIMSFRILLFETNITFPFLKIACVSWFAFSLLLLEPIFPKRHLLVQSLQRK